MTPKNNFYSKTYNSKAYMLHLEKNNLPIHLSNVKFSINYFFHNPTSISLKFDNLNSIPTSNICHFLSYLTKIILNNNTNITFTYMFFTSNSIIPLKEDLETSNSFSIIYNPIEHPSTNTSQLFIDFRENFNEKLLNYNTTATSEFNIENRKYINSILIELTSKPIWLPNNSYKGNIFKVGS